MSEIIKKMTSLNLKNKNLLLLVVGALALGILLISEFGFNDKKGSENCDYTYNYNPQVYIEKTEKELEKLLSGISGAGKVKVMLTLENRYENIYAKGYNTKNDDSENSKRTEVQEEYIIVKKSSNNEECLIEKVNEPSIKGVAVVAQGADDVLVKTAITETVCALFNISSAKVSVTKMINK